MKVLVCVKQVIDTSVPLEVDYAADTVRWTDAEFYALNPADAWAVQRAVQLKKDLGVGPVTVVSVGPERVIRALRECLALGADAALRVDDGGFDEPPDALGTAAVLAAVVDSVGPDLVMCGATSADTGMRCLGPVLATMRGLPYVPDVLDFEVEPGPRALIARRQLSRGDEESVRCPLPALLTLAPRMCPSYASLPMMIRAWRASVQTPQVKDLRLARGEGADDLNRTRLVKVSPPKPRPKKIFMPDSSLPPEERLKQLLAGGPTRQKSADFLEGAAGDVAAQAIEFLKQQKLL